MGNESLSLNDFIAHSAKVSLNIIGRATKRARTSEIARDEFPTSLDKGNKALEVPITLSSAKDARPRLGSEEDDESTPIFVTKLLCDRIFGGLRDVTDPYFIGHCMQRSLLH